MGLSHAIFAHPTCPAFLRTVLAVFAVLAGVTGIGTRTSRGWFVCAENEAEQQRNENHLNCCRVLGIFHVFLHGAFNIPSHV
jgi:hypothetical protein